MAKNFLPCAPSEVVAMWRAAQTETASNKPGFLAPDWKQAGLYPDPSRASMARWAWEFLRRNSDYQAAWRGRKATAAAQFGLRTLVDPMSKFSLGRVRFLKSGGIRLISPGSTFEPGGHDDVMLDPSRDSGEQLKQLAETAAAERHAGRVDYVETIEYGPGILLVRLHRRRAVERTDLTRQAIVIDYHLPIAPQLARIKWYVQTLHRDLVKAGTVQEHDARRTGPRLLIYLRVFDARHARPPATFAKIAEILKVSEKSAQRFDDIAQSMVDSGYQDLPPLQRPPRRRTHAAK